MRSAGARPFHLGLGHARAGFCLQAGTDIDDLTPVLGNIRHGWILRLSARPAGRDEGRQVNLNRFVMTRIIPQIGCLHRNGEIGQDQHTS